MEQRNSSRESNRNKLSDSLLVLVGIPWLRDGDEYEKHLESCLRHVENQETTVKTLIYKTKGDTRVLEGINKIFQITRKLNEIVEFFMRTKATHLWILDADVEVPPHSLDTMIRRNKDIVTGIYYPRKRKDVVTAGTLTPHKAKGLKYIALKPEEVIGRVLDNGKYTAGNGCVLIKKRVFQKIRENIDPLRFRYSDGARGSDIQFFIDAQSLGFPVTVDGTVLCGHLPYTPLSDLVG